jgi:SAM-dependent methyltransferase
MNIDPSQHDGFQSELAYWDRELSLQGDYPDAILNRSVPERMEREFPGYLSKYFEEIRQAAEPSLARVLDVGSGPLSMLNWGAQSGLFELTAADPLASEYERLLQKHGLTPLCRMVTAFGEELGSQFEQGSFDLVWIHNALDHSQSPREVMEQCTLLLRPGGYLVFQGWSHEATAEGWIGLHRHNIWLSDSLELFCESRLIEEDPRTVSLCDGLKLELVESMPPTVKVKQWIRMLWRCG